MTFEFALSYLQKAKAIAADLGIEASVAIVDAAGHPVLIARGKAEAWHGPYMSAGKARLSAAFRKPTARLIEQWADRPYYVASLHDVIPGGITVNPGGYPIFQDGACIGAIGIGGSAPDLDDQIALATVTAMGGLGERLR